MQRDFALAALHHVLAFGLVAMLASQLALLRARPDAPAVRRLGRLDMGYGATATALLVVGLLRVYLGVKGAGFYLHNPWFHAKVGAYVLVAALSLVPTFAFARWRRALQSDAGALPAEAEWSRCRHLAGVQVVLVLAIAILASGMARYGGL